MTEITDASQLIAPLIDEQRLRAMSRISARKKIGFVCGVTGTPAGDHVYVYREPARTKAGKLSPTKTRIICVAYDLPLMLRGLNSALEDHPEAFEFARNRIIALSGAGAVPMAPPLGDITRQPDQYFGNDDYHTWRSVKAMTYTLEQYQAKRKANKGKSAAGGVKKSAGKAKRKAPVKAKMKSDRVYVLGTAGTEKSITEVEDVKTFTSKRRALLKHAAITLRDSDNKFVIDYVPYNAESKAKQNAWFPHAEGNVLVQPLRSLTWTAGAMEISTESN